MLLQLDEGATHLDAYFPKGMWYNLRSHASTLSSGQLEIVTQAIEEPASSFVAGGNIIAMGQPAMTTREVRYILGYLGFQPTHVLTHPDGIYVYKSLLLLALLVP